MSRRARWIAAAGVLIGILIVTPQYIKAYRIHGPSDAPTYLWDDVVLANRAAYDLRLPFSDIILVKTGDPRRGDMVFVRRPDAPYDVTRRIVGLPGDTIEIRSSRVILNGEPLRYESVEGQPPGAADTRNEIGAVVEMEWGAGMPHPITYTPGECGVATTSPVVVPPGSYFVLGDNRDHCEDSRRTGPVDRRWIRARLVGRVLTRRH